jgi:hypothetical protein
VIAARHSQHAIASGIGIEQADPVRRTAKLERTRVLQMLALQIDITAAQPGQHRAIRERRDRDLWADRAMCVLDSLK